MPKPPPRRHLDPSEFTTPEQHLEHVRGKRVENPEYAAARAAALKAAGLADEGDDAAAGGTPEDHYRALRRD